MKIENLTLDQSMKRMFRGVSNDELIRRANNAPDFKWDNEACEIDRRSRECGLKVQMQGNRIVIVTEIEQDGENNLATEENTGLKFGKSTLY